MRGWLRGWRPRLRPQYGATTVGLDVGSGAIKALEVAHDGDGPEVIRMGICAVPADIAASWGTGDPAGMAELLRGFWAREHFGRRAVVIATARDWVSIEPDHGAASGATGPGWLPIPPEQAVMDAQPVPLAGLEKVLVAAAERSRVSGLCAMLKLAGLEAGVMDVGTIALRNALLQSHPDAGEGCVAAIDLGYETARILLLRDGVPTVVRHLQTEPLTAAPSFGMVGDDQTALASELVQILEVALESSQPLTNGPGSDSDAFVGQVFVMGGGFLIPGMIQTLAEVTGVPVRRVQPFGRVALGPTADSNGLMAKQDILFLQALGLALRRH